MPSKMEMYMCESGEKNTTCIVSLDPAFNTNM